MTDKKQNIKEISEKIVDKVEKEQGQLADQQRAQHKTQGIQHLQKTIGDCENGITLLENCLFSGIAADRILRHKTWLETMKAGLTRELFKIQDTQAEDLRTVKR